MDTKQDFSQAINLNKIISLCGLIVGITTLVLFALITNGTFGSVLTIDASSKYHVVALTNGQGFIGKVQEVNTTTMILHDPYYLQGQVDPETKKVSKHLIRRQEELHKPTAMHINVKNIIYVEGVGVNSPLAQLLQKQK